jgi:hypothetical protein
VKDVIVKLTKKTMRDMKTVEFGVGVEGVVNVKFKTDRLTRADLTELIYGNRNEMEVPGTLEVK